MGVTSGQSAHLAFTRVFASLLCRIQPEQAKGETVQGVQSHKVVRLLNMFTMVSFTMKMGFAAIINSSV